MSVGPDVSTELVISIRRNVIAGGVATISIEGDADADNAKILNALRLIWQTGHERFGWHPLGVDRDNTPSPLGRRRYRKN